MNNLNFLISGFGGQGTVLAGDIMAEVGMLAGYDAKKSDVLGLAIRGGSVTSQIRWGERVDAPLSMPGDIDFLLGFEPLETLRQLGHISSKSVVVYNEYKVPPVTVASGLATYPADEELAKALRDTARYVYSFNATQKAVELGNVKTVNVMLLGALASQLDVSYEIWETAIKKFVPEKAYTANVEAFRTGHEMATAAAEKV